MKNYAKLAGKTFLIKTPHIKEIFQIQSRSSTRSYVRPSVHLDQHMLATQTNDKNRQKTELGKKWTKKPNINQTKKKKNNHKQVERIQEFRGPGETKKERGDGENTKWQKNVGHD